MRVQRVLDSECRCWNPALCVLVSFLGSLVLVTVSVLLRQGESKQDLLLLTYSYVGNVNKIS